MQCCSLTLLILYLCSQLVPDCTASLLWRRDSKRTHFTPPWSTGHSKSKIPFRFDVPISIDGPFGVDRMQIDVDLHRIQRGLRERKSRLSNVRRRRVAAATRTNGLPSLPLPCAVPKLKPETFASYCQSEYHQLSYLCDPSGLLSRTESDILDFSVRSLNLSTCFCTSTSTTSCSDSDSDSDRLKLGIVIIAAADTHDVQRCDSSTVTLFPMNTFPVATFQFANQLRVQWEEFCHPDIFIVYIDAWNNRHSRHPFIIPLYQGALAHLSRYSIPYDVRPRETAASAIHHALRATKSLLQIQLSQNSPTVPKWALMLSLFLLTIMCLAVRLANYVTQRLSGAQRRRRLPINKIIRPSSNFRAAGFGGGVMMNQQASIARKSTNMFRSFHKRQQPQREGMGRI